MCAAQPDVQANLFAGNPDLMYWPFFRDIIDLGATNAELRDVVNPLGGVYTIILLLSIASIIQLVSFADYMFKLFVSERTRLAAAGKIACAKSIMTKPKSAKQQARQDVCEA